MLVSAHSKPISLDEVLQRNVDSIPQSRVAKPKEIASLTIGGNVDDAAASRPHSLHCGAAEVEHTVDIGVERQAPIVIRGFEGASTPNDPGAVHQDVDLSEQLTTWSVKAESATSPSINSA
ncbi:hypothetical protein [Mesorhizobium delmotii]|uniref:hypothetical protein n=1 Tax=Mesorhizobium delmotii TaxID=1631247 RepID=UPI003CC7EB73